MLDIIRQITLVGATLTTGMMAGIFFIFTVGIMPGLGRADDRTFVGSFQSIDRAFTEAPTFLLTFTAALLLPALAVILHLADGYRAVLPWAVAAFVLYLVVFIVTVRYNVPLNDELKAAGDPDQIANLAAIRERFEDTWVRWNNVRTLACIPAFGLMAWALAQYPR